VTVSTACCSSLDNIITFIFRKGRKKDNGETLVVEKLRDIVKVQNNVFQQVGVLLTVLLTVLLIITPSIT